MKKMITMILTIAMLLTAMAAFAEGRQGGPMGGPQQGQMEGDPRQGGMGPGQGGEKPFGAPEKPSDAPEKPTGEKPADAPEEPEDLTGERPEMPADAQAPADGQQPSEKPADGQAPADGQQPPQKPADGQAPVDGQQPPQKPADGQAPADGQQPPQKPAGDKRIDFDAMVTKGIISQETRDKIKAYMDEHKPESEAPQGVPGEGQAPVDGQTPPEKPTGEKPADAPVEPADGQGPDLLSDLLNAGIITQAEYEAINASING